MRNIFKYLFKLSDNKNNSPKQHIKKRASKVTASRIVEIGEYKIDIQLDQMPKNYKYLSDILIKNTLSTSGYSQVDHVVFTPYAVFVIETKNYTGTIYGDRQRAEWRVNGKFKMMNPFNQNFGHIKAVKNVLALAEDDVFVSIVSFNRRCTFKVNEELRKIQSSELIVYDTELSEFITRKVNVMKLQSKSEVFTDEAIVSLYEKLSKYNITDPLIREEHIKLLQSRS